MKHAKADPVCPCQSDQDPRAQQLTAWIEQHKHEPGIALPALQKAQEIYGFLPEAAQRVVAQGLGKSLSEIYGIATFYSMFSLTPKGRNHINVCLGTACYYQFDPYMEIQLEADQVPAIKTFSQSIVKWLEEHGAEENRVIQQYGLSFPKIRRFADELGHVCDVAMEHGYGLSGLGD